MEKNAIIRDLKREKKTRHDNVNLGVNELKGLLVQDTERDIDVYRQMGISGQFEQVLDEKSKVITEKNIAKEFGTDDVVHIDDIERVAIKYNLRFLETKRYNGYVEAGLARTVQDFCDEHNVIVGNATRDLYILAREEDFNLDNRPVPITPPKDLDPILFYRIMPDDHKDRNYYKMVTKWGNDLSPSRAISAWKYKDIGTVWSHTFFKWFLYMYTFMTAISFLFIQGFEAFSISRTIFSLILGAVVAFLAVTDVDKWESVEDITTDKLWNDEHKRSRKWYR